MLSNAVREWIVGRVQTGLMTMTISLWIRQCLATPYMNRRCSKDHWAKDHAKAMDDHKTATRLCTDHTRLCTGHTTITQTGLVDLLEVRIASSVFFLSGSFLPYVAK